MCTETSQVDWAQKTTPKWLFKLQNWPTGSKVRVKILKCCGLHFYLMAASKFDSDKSRLLSHHHMMDSNHKNHYLFFEGYQKSTCPWSVRMVMKVWLFYWTLKWAWPELGGVNGPIGILICTYLYLLDSYLYSRTRYSNHLNYEKINFSLSILCFISKSPDTFC